MYQESPDTGCDACHSVSPLVRKPSLRIPTKQDRESSCYVQGSFLDSQRANIPNEFGLFQKTGEDT